MARILVTGAQGFIGSWVVKQLLDRGEQVVTFDQDPNPARLIKLAGPESIARVVTRTGSIEDTAAIKAIVKNDEITGILHLAAVLMPFCQNSPVLGGITNVIGTLNVFEAARDAGRPVRIVYASSSAVWGPDDAYEPRALDESDPLHPATHYGVFKQTNEANARVFFHTDGISSVGLRPWAVYGYGRETGLTADPTLAIRAVVSRTPFQIRIQGKLDLQYVEDVAATFLGCLFHEQSGAHVFNLAGEVVDMEAFIEALDEVLPGARGLITAGGVEVPVAKHLNAAALRAFLPDLAYTNLQDGINRTAELFEMERHRARL